MVKLLAIFLSVFASVAIAASPSPTTQAEISHLFVHLESSGCKFNRNGTWYTAAEATGHLQTKYNYLLKKGLVTTTESFIDNGAATSSVSGKPYLVQCGGAEPVPSAVWLKAELSRLRNKNEPSK